MDIYSPKPVDMGRYWYNLCEVNDSYESVAFAPGECGGRQGDAGSGCVTSVCVDTLFASALS